MATEDKDYYGLLGVEDTATLAEIRTAYRKKSLKVHPDRNPDNPEAANLFHELTLAQEVLLDPTQRASYDALQASRKAKKLRFAALDNKRKAQTEELERREREFKKQKGDEDLAERQKKNELERLKEEGRKMREAREKAAQDVLDRDEGVERIKERDRRKRQEAQQHAHELGPLDLNLRIKWTRTKHPNVVDVPTVQSLLSSLSPSSASDIDSIVLSSKFLANPTKGKYGSGMVAFKTLNSAVKLMEAQEKGKGGKEWDGVELGWASGAPPAILGGEPKSPPTTKTSEPPSFASSFPASMLTDSSESKTLELLRQKEREKLIEELKRQEEEEG